MGSDFFHAKKKTTKKQIKGTMNDKAVDRSDIKPITGGTTAPPTIDMIINDEAFFVCSPRFLTPNANMVGNIMDIKKKTPINANTAIIPGNSITMAQSRTLITEYTARRMRGEMVRIKAVPAKRPTVNSIKQIDNK